MSEGRGSVLTDDGVRLAFKTAGEGPHNLLLMYGWAGSADNWNGFVRALDPQAFRAFASDFRGHGDSDKATAGFTDERLAKGRLASSPVVEFCGSSLTHCWREMDSNFQFRARRAGVLTGLYRRRPSKVFAFPPKRPVSCTRDRWFESISLQR